MTIRRQITRCCSYAQLLTLPLPITLLSSLHAQASPVGSPSQMIQGITLRIGMPEEEALRLVSTTFYRARRLLPFPGNAVDSRRYANYMVVTAEDSTAMVGSFSVRDGRVSIITSDWTPATESLGATGEALVSLLSLLTTTRDSDRYRVSSGCDVRVSEGLTAGTDQQGRIGSIVCGRSTIDISVFRMAGGPSTLQLQLVTR